MDDRYYTQRVSDREHLVRELQQGKALNPDDRVIRHFQTLENAQQYAESVNRVQRELDKTYGHWVKRAI